MRNQFFTPDYVVSFLVHNTLGRRLLESNPTSQLRVDLDWLVDPPAKQGTVVALESVKVLDPACGSGHFLLGAYEILERAWLHSGVDPKHAAPMIVPCLWGVDIDPRAAQVAAAAVMLRARRSCGTGPILPRPNTVCARVLPAIPESTLAVTASFLRLSFTLASMMSNPCGVTGTSKQSDMNRKLPIKQRQSEVIRNNRRL